jgi:hypothetical protein
LKNKPTGQRKLRERRKETLKNKTYELSNQEREGQKLLKNKPTGQRKLRERRKETLDNQTYELMKIRREKERNSR